MTRKDQDDPLYGFTDTKDGIVAKALHFLEVAAIQQGKDLTDMRAFKSAVLLRDKANAAPDLIAAQLAEDILVRAMHSESARVRKAFNGKMASILDKKHAMMHVAMEDQGGLASFIKNAPDDLKKSNLATGAIVLEDVLDEHKGKALTDRMPIIAMTPLGAATVGEMPVSEFLRQALDEVKLISVPASGTLKAPAPALEAHFTTALRIFEERLAPAFNESAEAAPKPHNARPGPKAGNSPVPHLRLVRDDEAAPAKPAGKKKKGPKGPSPKK